MQDADAARERGWRTGAAGAAAGGAAPASHRSRARPGPRGHTPEEHQELRLQAQLLKEALQPRAPTPDDLRLTSRVMCATHWHDVLVLLGQHERACLEQRVRQQEGWVQRQQQGPGAQAQLEPGLARQQQQQGQQQQRDAQQLPGPGRSSRGAAAAPAPTTSSPSASGAASTARAAGAGTRSSAAGGAGHLQSPQRAFEPDGGPPPVSALPFTPQHVAVMLMRTAHLMSLLGGAASPEEARQLHGLVERLARMALALLPSPGMGLREIVTVFHSLVRLRHPVGKPYFVALMSAAHKRFTAKAPAAPAVARRGKQRPASQTVPADPNRRPAAAAVSSASGAPSFGSGGSGAGGGGATEGDLPYSAHDMSLLIWCVAGCGMERLRDDWAAAYGSALLPTVPYMAAQGVSMVLYSMARLRCQPPPEVLQSLCGRLSQLCAEDPPPTPPQRGQAGAAAAQGAGQGHDRSAEGLLAAPGPGLEQGQRQGQAVLYGQPQHALAPVQQGLGQQHQQQPGRAAGAWAEHDPAGAFTDPTAPAHDSYVPWPGPEAEPARQGAPPRCRCRPADVSMTLWALATLRLQPERYCPQLLPALEAHSLARLPGFDQQELSTVVWALAKLKHTPGAAWLASLYGTVRCQLGELQPRALAMLLYGLATMGQRPGREWLGDVVARAREVLPGMTPQALALTVHALATMGYRPEEAWLAAFHSQLEANRGRLDTRVRDKVREAYRLFNFRPGAAPSTPGAGARAAGPPQQPQQRQRAAQAREAGQRAGWADGDLDEEFAVPPVALPVEGHGRDVAVMVKPSRFGFK